MMSTIQTECVASASAKVLRPREAAAYTGLSESTLAKRRIYGKPPRFVSLGGRAVGYLRDDLDAWIESNLRTSTSDTDSSTELDEVE